MKYVVVAVPAAPLRLKPRHQKEMVSQLLFGEMAEVIKSKGDLWIKIRSTHDAYEGWITRNLLVEVNKEQVNSPIDYVADDLLNIIVLDNKTMNIPAGSSLPEFSNGKGIIGGLTYEFNGVFRKRTEQPASEELLKQLCFRWINAPYMWGGRTLMGVDCSGFVQVNYKMMGIDLPRDAWQQAQEGKTVSKLRDARAGDLAFFDDKDEIVHVGILLGPDKIIHSSGKVRIDVIDKKGITNGDTGKRTHRLQAIKRLW